MNREQMLCLAAFAALTTFANAARADGYLPADEPFQPAAMTCAQATANAWFIRQMELSDGDVDPAYPTPAECQRTLVANLPQGDREVIEEK